ncbi:hypothetical protein Bbelb_321910 [Branchiostoma belcheri]|nr:hypothetical protein Bbelb_321910 [Branchiostoma belcheri]
MARNNNNEESPTGAKFPLIGDKLDRVSLKPGYTRLECFLKKGTLTSVSPTTDLKGRPAATACIVIHHRDLRCPGPTIGLQAPQPHHREEGPSSISVACPADVPGPTTGEA